MLDVRKQEAKMKSTVWMAILILAIVASGLLLNKYWVPRAPLAFATIAAGVITFFYCVSAGGFTSVGEGRMRGAIASAIIIQYIVMVGFVAYFTPSYSKESQQLDAVAAMLIPSFTSIVGVVIAFYFGASVYVEAQNKRSSPRYHDAQQSASADTKERSC
jgi:hypothetical protein